VNKTCWDVQDGLGAVLSDNVAMVTGRSMVALFLTYRVFIGILRKENEVALQRAEMRMIRWMCDVKVKDRVPSNE